MKSFVTGCGIGGAEGDRTPDLVIANVWFSAVTSAFPSVNIPKTPPIYPILRKTAQNFLRNLCGFKINGSEKEIL